jgi:hypothetical protein
MLSLEYSVTKIFESNQGRYNTDAILADGKISIRYPIPPLPSDHIRKSAKAANVTKDLPNLRPDADLSIESYGLMPSLPFHRIVIGWHWSPNIPGLIYVS